MLNFLLNVSGAESIFWTDNANSTKHQHLLWVLGIPDYENDLDIMATKCGLTSSDIIKTNAHFCQRGEYISLAVKKRIEMQNSKGTATMIYRILE